MQLPKLTPGKRHALARPPGSADALLLAQLAQQQPPRSPASHGALPPKGAAADLGRPGVGGEKLTAIITADAGDARRLQDELAFFAPALRVVLFPDWETLPYDTFSPHQGQCAILGAP